MTCLAGQGKANRIQRKKARQLVDVYSTCQLLTSRRLWLTRRRMRQNFEAQKSKTKETYTGVNWIWQVKEQSALIHTH
jgi:hypothetical protein